MNRADLLYSVLKDGQRHSRRDIQERVGFFLTNNAASELRKRGLEVVHEREGRNSFYSLNETVGSEGGSAVSLSEGSSVPHPPGTGPASGLTAITGAGPDPQRGPNGGIKGVGVCRRCGVAYDGYTGHGPGRCEKLPLQLNLED